MRKIQVTIPGRWYFGLLLMIGAVSMISLNNVVYLVESILISALLLSILTPHLNSARLQVEVKRKPVSALGTNRDMIRLTNRGNRPVFCIEVGEWHEGRFTRLAFFPYVAPRGTATAISSQPHPVRGLHRWDGVAVATSYPFGFLRIVRIFPGEGQRKVWPSRIDQHAKAQLSAAELIMRAGGVPMSGEVRPMNQDDDYRSIIWTLSARGLDPVVRPRGGERESPGVTLDLRQPAGEAFERAVSRAATDLSPPGALDSGEGQDEASLEIIDWRGRRKLTGRRRALDELAIVEAVGARKAA